MSKTIPLHMYYVIELKFDLLELMFRAVHELGLPPF
jgi:hypothetical protein